MPASMSRFFIQLPPAQQIGQTLHQASLPAAE
jgi:hypothetical protein